MKRLQPIKSPEQIEAMRQGGQKLAWILGQIRKHAQPGVTPQEIDQMVGEWISEVGAEPTYKIPEINFPANICISKNNAIVHGIPDDVPLETGDVVSFDLTITYDGMCTDSAFTMVIGESPAGSKKHLLNQTERALKAGIGAVKAGAKVGDVSAAIEKSLTKAKLGIVRELVGHGVGNEIHMPPEIPNYGAAGTGPVLSAGDTLAIEPMATLGKEKIKIDPDGWTIWVADGSLSAHFEHTVLVTETGCEILTAKINH